MIADYTKREGMQPHWLEYAVLDGIAVCLHRYVHGPGYCVCVQYHPPHCAVAPPDGRKYNGHDRAEAQAAFDEWAEKLRAGELYR